MVFTLNDSRCDFNPDRRAHAPARWVLDTNVVIDMLHFADRHALPLLAAIDAGRVRCFTDAECLAELERVLAYPEFHLAAAAQAALLDDYRRRAEFSPADEGQAPPYRLPRCRDADDQKFLALAARSLAHALITRDRELLRLARRAPFAILSPEAAGRSIAAAAEDPARLV